MRHGAEGATEKGLEMDVKADIAAEAVRIVTGARRSAYGMPERNFERIARLWNAHLANRFHGLPEEVRLGPGDVAALMRLMKEARLAETPDHWDSYVDIAGYCLAGAEAVGVKRPADAPASVPVNVQRRTPVYSVDTTAGLEDGA